MPLRESRRLDGNSPAHGVSLSRLMANAGEALARAIGETQGGRVSRERREGAKRGLGREARPHLAPVWFLCGKGNNGGDGFAAAAVLRAQGHDVRVVLLDPDVRSPEARAHLMLLPRGLLVHWDPALRPPRDAVLVDCLLGAGIKGAPRDAYAQAVRWLGARRKDGHRIVSCDVPSGFGTSLAVQPDETVTFHAKKEGMTRANSGRILVAPIGIPDDASRFIGPGDLDVGYARLDPDAHKGDHGVVLVIAGGPYTGAPHYAGMAAYRTGADMVWVATPKAAADTISTWGPDLLVRATEPGDHFTTASLDATLPLLDKCGSVVLGPGMGRHRETAAFVRAVLPEIHARDLPLVLDADPLRFLADKELRPHAPRTVFTPHKGEAKALAGGTSDAHLIRWAQERKTTLVRKGRVDLVAAATPRWCKCGHPTMTVGGTGDVLAGVIGALLAKGATPYDAACAATYLNGRAGELAGADLGPGATATDVLERIPRILRDL